MVLRKHVPLASLTTFKTGGTARHVYECANHAELQTALAYAREGGLSWYVLGEGSNMLAPDAGYSGVIIRIHSTDIEPRVQNGMVSVIVDAGVSWDTLVSYTAERAWWGIENLAAIPGTVGAAPVQNIGAYGVEVGETILWVEAYDTRTDSVVHIPAEDCGFAYRTSRFKEIGSYVVLRVCFALFTAPQPKLSYPDITARREKGAVLDTPHEITTVIREIRAAKFPDLTMIGTAGSFFKNPIVAPEAYAVLQEKYPRLPGFTTPQGIKIPIAWVLDHVLHLRGYAQGKCALYEKQPLVLIAHAGATSTDVEKLADEIAARVHAATDITLEREVQKLFSYKIKNNL